jgi:hypothetical protein
MPRVVLACEEWTLLNRWNLCRLPEGNGQTTAAMASLCALAAHGDVLFHGSTRSGIERFEPREQTTYGGQPTRAVFATPDPVWATFFAVTDFARAQSRWNGCLLPEETGFRQARYFFSVGCAPAAAWSHGAVYVLPRRAFTVSDSPAEWLAAEAVTPLSVVPVTPADFPYRSHVFRHERGDADWHRLLRLWRAGLTRRG